MKNKTKGGEKGIFRRVLRYIGKYRIFFFLSVLLAALSVALTLYLPIIFGDAVDIISADGGVDFSALREALIKAGIVILATAALRWIMNAANNRITYGVCRDVRSDAIKKIEHLPFSFLDSHPEGETVSRVITDVDQFTDGLLMGFTQLFTGITTILGTVGFMLAINWKIALAVIVITPVSLLIAQYIAKKTYSLFRRQSETRGEQTAFVQEMVENQKIVRAYSHERENAERFTDINERLKKTSLSATFFSSLVNPTTRVVNNIVYAAVCLTGAAAAIGATLSIGALSCLLAYATQYAKPFNEISGVVTELQNAAACAKRVFDLIDEKEESPDGAEVLGNALGNVVFNDVSFSYTKDKKLIENLSLNAKKGVKVAIVGPTGCGKTTLINLLMRFYEADKGEIRVDGKSIEALTRHSLRENIGMVLQDTWIRSGTVRENITMGRTATDDEVVAAAKSAHAHSFIKRLSDGYDTVITPDSGLSQGQRQLLCIARIMLRVPPMLILDEATSSIDTRTEMKIQDAFGKMMKGRTSFIVAHRLSTVRDADVILVMRDGHIIEKGTHTELLAAGGFYSELYNSQFAK